MSLLLLDAGNTRLKWRQIHQGRTLAEGVAAYDALHTPPWPEPPSQALGCNVAGEARAATLAALLPECPLVWIRPDGMAAGVRNSYVDPGQLGPDRWAALIAVHAMMLGDCLVATAGTALTLDALVRVPDTDESCFLGGLIVPGYQLMRTALAHGTARLGLPDGESKLFPQQTGEAIVNGARIALAGAIQLQYARLAAYTGRRPHLVLSGGDAEVIRPLLPADLDGVCVAVDNLVLNGLAVLAEASANRTSS
jgi:type III pantothenate kinase